jgi:hypothetical protein
MTDIDKQSEKRSHLTEQERYAQNEETKRCQKFKMA